MFRKIKKLYFKIYHLFKLLGVFILIIGFKSNVYAETQIVSKYYIKDGIFQEQYQFNNVGGTASYGSIQENYNNEGYVLIACRTWSAWNLEMENAEVQTGDIIKIRYKRRTIYTSLYSQYAEMKIITKKENDTAEVNNTIFYGIESTYNDYKVHTYEAEQDANFSIYIANLADMTNYTDYGVEIKDVWVEREEEIIIPEVGETYSSFLTLYTNKINYLANGFTTNPYLIAMIGIIFAWVVLELLLKILHLRGGYKK